MKDRQNRYYKAKNSKTGLFYNREKGGFYSFGGSATVLNREQLLIVKHTYNNVEEIPIFNLPVS